MTTEQRMVQHLQVQLVYLKLALLIIDFPEVVEGEEKGESVRPPLDVALNGKSGSEDDE
jgi:hypothetical protein